MKSLEEQLWEAVNLNPVWPSDLLENIKDPDYKKVEVTPLDNGCEVQLIFVDNGEIVSANYFFNEKDFLVRAIMIENGIESEIYDRDSEIKMLISKIKSNSSLTIAI